jgi:predicted phosphohydrolase
MSRSHGSDETAPSGPALRLQILSDVHLELRKTMPELPPVLASKMALLGDIGSLYRDFLGLMSRLYDHVFLLAGNHEYYNRRRTHHAIAEEIEVVCAAFDNVYFLDNDTVEVEGVRYVGTTLWSHVPKADETIVTRGIKDYTRIQRAIYDPTGSGRTHAPVTVNYTNVLHEAAVHFLKTEMAADSGLPMVVLSHHAPSMRSVAGEFEGSPLNSAFATGLEGMLKAPPVVAWLHGHTQPGRTQHRLRSRLRH